MTRVPTKLRRVQPQIGKAMRAATMAASPVTRGVSRLFRERALPSSHYKSTGSYLEDHPSSGVRVTRVKPQIELSRKHPRGLPPDHRRFVNEDRWLVRPATVTTIPRGRVVGDYGAIIAPENAFLFDLSPYFAVRRPEGHPIFRRIRLPRLEIYDDMIAVLACRGVDNYYHFLIDVLPRLALIEQVIPLDEIDYFVVKADLPFQQQLLAHMGIAERVLDSRSSPHIQARQLIVPSLPAQYRQTPPWISQFLKERLMSDQRIGTRRRLYVSRGTAERTRRIVNEEEVVGMLAALDVETMRPEKLGVKEQIRMFSEAELIISPHGAAMANLMFCEPGTTVIEMLAPNNVNPATWKDCCQLNLEYFYLIGEGGTPRPEGDMDHVTADIKVDVNKLKTVLDMAGF